MLCSAMPEYTLACTCCVLACSCSQISTINKKYFSYRRDVRAAVWGCGPPSPHTRVAAKQGQGPSQLQHSQVQGQGPSQLQLSQVQGQVPSQLQLSQVQGQDPSQLQLFAPVVWAFRIRPTFALVRVGRGD